MLDEPQDPTETEGTAEGFVGFNVEEEEDKMQSAGLRKIKKTCKAAMDKTGRKVTLTCHS
jgi:hypothetical protein